MSDIDSSTLSVTDALASHWGLVEAKVVEHPGGMSSLTWVVHADGRRLLAKSVSARKYAQRFANGLAAAERLSAAGIPAGAPVPTLDNAPTALIGDRSLALLEWVDGVPVDRDAPGGQELIGRTLARAHLALGTVPAQQRIEPPVNAAALHLLIRPWIRPAIERARAAVNELGVTSLTWGPLHGDPAADAFLYDAATGTCGLIDWGAHLIGPRVFDLASAVVYAGGVERAQGLVGAYLDEGALSAAEAERTLDAMVGWRWASQAWYFAWRIAEGNLTGIADPSENEKGLADAKAHIDAAQIRDYRPTDEVEWLRCRAVVFVDTCYFDSVYASKPIEDDADEVVELVAVDDGRVVAMLDVAVRGDLATIENVCVHPDHRGRGLATRLLLEARARLAGGPARTLDAWTREDASALGWYASAGFVEEYTYLHVYSGYGKAESARLVEPRKPFTPVSVFAHASRELEEQVRREYERVYVCRRMVRALP